jgi:hypothetical protein
MTPGEKCDIQGLKGDFPKNFQSWTSEGESILANFGCSLQMVPSKNGVVEHFVGNRINSNVFEVYGYIEATNNYNEEKEKWNVSLGNLHSFKKRKFVINGMNGTGALLTMGDAPKVLRSLKDLVNSD